MFGSSMFSSGNQPLSKERKPAKGKGLEIGRRPGSKQDKTMKKRIDSNLSGSKFRILNEFLYTSPSQEAVQYFKENNHHFNDYHEGFAKQTEDWPVRPLDVIIQELASDPFYNNNVVIDLGCGEGLLYEYFEKKGRILEEDSQAENKDSEHNYFQKILSYDLVSTKDFIQACDIKNLPLGSGSVDTAVFCLALMGTNYLDFIMEAHRVLRAGGRLIVAEVLSRFSDLRLFVILTKKIGFKFVKYVKKNSYFVTLIFKKINKKSPIWDLNSVVDIRMTSGHKPKLRYREMTYREMSQKLLQPCIYKKR